MTNTMLDGLFGKTVQPPKKKHKLKQMTITALANFIKRTYNESVDYQWAREAYVNAEEAGATQVSFEIEWQGAMNKGVYRRLILDNGSGMMEEDMPLYTNSLGASSKAVGGDHENFGQGLRTSLMPWNPLGVVIVSKAFSGYKSDGEPQFKTSMMRIEYDAENESYGAATVNDGFPKEVYAPYDATDTEGVDFSQLIPSDWDTGTAILLMGSPEQPDTILGASDRDESTPYGLFNFLNTRFWDLTHMDVTVDHIDTSIASNKSEWPKDDVAPKVGKWGTQTVLGAKRTIEMVQKPFGEVEASGIVKIANGLATANWYLRSGVASTTGQGGNRYGCVSYVYRNELYSTSRNTLTFRSLGIPKWLKNNVFVIFTPKESDGVSGVKPNGARTLLLQSGTGGNSPLPNTAWNGEFNEKLPDAITSKIREHNAGQTDSTLDANWRERLQVQWGHLWKITRLITSATGKTDILPTGKAQPEKPRKPVNDPPRPYIFRGGHAVPKVKRIGPADPSTTAAATERKVDGGVPHCRLSSPGDFDEDNAWVIATWERPSAANDNRGCVIINQTHPEILKHIADIIEKRAGDPDEITKVALAVYSEMAVTAAAHALGMKSTYMTDKEVDERYLTDEAMSYGLMGFLAADALIGKNLDRKMIRRKTV